MNRSDASHDLAPQPLDRARALHARYYADPAMVAVDRQLIFDRGWQLLAHVCQLQNAGDHVVSDFAGLPVITVRGADGQIRVFHNVCRHRAGPLAQCDGLAAKSLRCRYHGWTYTLEGTLRSAPEMGTATEFDVGDIKLPQLAVRVWQGLVFAAVDEAHAPAFDAFVKDIDARLGPDRHLERYGHHRRVGYDVGCNWKIYVDNYLEGYHVPHVHPGLNKLLDYRNYVTETHDWYSLQWSPLESSDDLYGSGDALYYWMWPNTMLNIVPGRMQTNRIIPKGVDKCRVEFDFYYAMDESEEASARRLADVRFSDEVQFEDLTICEDVQRGLASGSYEPGRLNPLRENAVHHFHELLRSTYRNAGLAEAASR
jgi:choline monooxygenase